MWKTSLSQRAKVSTSLLFLSLLPLLGFALALSPAFPKSTLHVEWEGKRWTLLVEVAATPEARARGLMFRKGLGENEGMVFLFPRPTNGGFWMKDTLIPLSIAFFDREGRILRILDMVPCRKDPCPVYRPGLFYSGALEVNQGWFARRGIREGARVKGPALLYPKR